MERSRKSNCINVANFVEIAPTATESSYFFLFSKMAAAATLNFEISNF